MQQDTFTHAEQQVMERRYSLPYNWFSKHYSRAWRQKNGLWLLAHALSGSLVGKQVLDVGCGDGWYTARMVEDGAQAGGVDYSQKAISFASLINEQAQFACASIYELPYPDQSFDSIFSFQVIEHLPIADLPKAVKELRRILKDDGKLIVSVPSTLRPMSGAHFQHFTPESFTQTFTPYFVVVDMVGQEKGTWLLRMIERVLQNRYWLLMKAATWFNIGPFLSHYNRTSPERGQNLVACFAKADSKLGTV